MTLEEVKKIIIKEQLKDSNILEDRAPKPNELILKQIGNKWIVEAADERAAIVGSSIVEFDNEEKACENFIRRLRASNEAAQLLSELFHY